LSSTPVDSLEVYHASLDDTARAGYFGALLREAIDAMARLLPGQSAPDFRVTLPDGRVMDYGLWITGYGFRRTPGKISADLNSKPVDVST
jgi:hypothetical protein